MVSQPYDPLREKEPHPLQQIGKTKQQQQYTDLYFPENRKPPRALQYNNRYQRERETPKTFHYYIH